MTATTAAATTFNPIEVQALVFELDAALARTRLELERDRLFVLMAYRQVWAKWSFSRVETMLRAAAPALTDDQLCDISTWLRKPLTVAHPALHLGERVRPVMRGPERRVFDSFARLVDRVDGLASDLVHEAERRRVHYPRIDGRLRHDALMANAFLPSVRRDQAEADPDPDYGF